MNRRVHKNRAKQLMSKNFTGSLLTVCIPLGLAIMIFVATVIGFESVSNVIVILNYLFMPITAALTIMFIKGEELDTQNQINKEVDTNIARYMSTMALTYLYTFLWTLLLFIPGIIKGYSYYLVPYILADEPDISNNDAITKSRKMMDGHKADVFLFDLSFILWGMLVGITFGLAAFYVIPYVNISKAGVYLELKNKYLIKQGYAPEPLPYGPDFISPDDSHSEYKEAPFTATVTEYKHDSEDVIVVEETFIEEEETEEVPVDNWKDIKPLKKVDAPKPVGSVDTPKEVIDQPKSVDDIKK